jgi:head-tail adaptor
MAKRQVDRAGDRIHHVEIQQELQTGVDQYNQQVLAWTTVAWRYASIEPIAGREKWQGQQVRPDVTHGITILYYPVIPKMRLKWAGRTFNVESALNPLEQQKSTVMQIQAIEEVG